MGQEPLTLGSSGIDVARYCRELETYLCQKNSGHLIRIVGPAFEQVCSWAERGVPLKIAFRGIDRYCERYYAKGARRRPVRIEFCEADILEAFDDWRRAVGVTVMGSGARAEPDSAGRRSGLAKHVERALGRLQTRAVTHADSAEFAAVVAMAIRELEHLVEDARTARGEPRLKIVERLGSLDALLLCAATTRLDEVQAAELKREAESELAPFGARLSPDARAKAMEAAYGRLVRDAVELPTLTYG